MTASGILCPIDFSETSTNALRWALDFSHEQQCCLRVLYTYRLIADTDPVTWRKKIEDDARQRFSEIEIKYLQPSGVQYEFTMEIGFMTHRIEDYARKNVVRFVVMAKSLCHDKDTFDELVKNIKVPMVILP